MRIVKFVTITSAILAFICMPTVVFLSISFSHAPSSPQPVNGAIVPYNYHGTYVYITHFQDVLLKSAFIVGLVALFVAIFCLRLQKRR